MKDNNRERSDRKRVSLPVVGQPKRAIDDVQDPGAPTARAPAAWILLGALATFAIFLPLAYVAVGLLGAIHVTSVAPTAIITSLCVALAALGGGYIVGRFGGHAGPREGALSGALVGLVLWAMTRMLLGVVIVAITAPLAYAGARIGRRSRKPGDSIGT
jgi:hypothetical protein